MRGGVELYNISIPVYVVHIFFFVHSEKELTLETINFTISITLNETSQ